MPFSASLRDRLRALLVDGKESELDRKLARSILGTDDVETIAARVEAYAREAFRRRVVGCALFSQSIGAVFALALEGGERVVLKAHSLGGGEWRSLTLREVEAVYEVQAALAAEGFPCASVVRAPRPWPGGAVAAMSYLEPHPLHDPHDPVVRRAMAEGMARTAVIGARFVGLPNLPDVRLPVEGVFPPPHNVLFDFNAPGGEWIDECAKAARAVLESEPEQPAVLHTDFSSSNVRVAGGRLVTVYDMDSVARMDEMRALASAAVHYTYLGDPPWRWPTREEARAFVEDYVRARGKELSASEKRRLDAAAVYSMAYSARCEHSFDGAPEEMRGRLREAGEAYLT